MRFRTKLILVNVSIGVAIMLIMAFVVTRSIYLFMFNNQVKYLSILSDEFSVMAESIIRDMDSAQTASLSYRSLTDHLCNEILQAYTMNSVLYDDAYTVLESSSADLPGDDLIDHVRSASENKTKGYVSMRRAGANYIVFISPVIVYGETVGYCAMFSATSNIDDAVRRVVITFSAAISIIAASIFVVYSVSYKRMLKPIVGVASFMRDMSGSNDLQSIDLNYKGNDEIRDLIDGSNMMISAIQDYLDELNYEKDKLISVIESMQDAIVAVNLSKDVLTTNEKFTEFFPSDIDYIKVVHHIDDLIKKVQNTRETVISEFPHDERTFLLSANRIAPPEKESGALIVIKDVTALKRMEADQNKFISSVSHELRTPLTTINGYIDLLQRRGTGDKDLTEKALETTKNETNRLLRMVNDLLNINKYKTAEFEFIFSDVDPNKLISEAVTEMNMRAETSNVMVEYNAVDLPSIRIDRDRIKQVITNVIDNGVKYSNPDSLVKVMAAVVEDFLEITIRDFGSGIPDDAREKVFDTFYRVEEDRSRLRGGFGLGLSIVKNIISRHGGTVAIDSQADQGTLVTIRLPLKKEMTNNSNEAKPVS